MYLKKKKKKQETMFCGQMNRLHYDSITFRNFHYLLKFIPKISDKNQNFNSVINYSNSIQINVCHLKGITEQK